MSKINKNIGIFIYTIFSLSPIVLSSLLIFEVILKRGAHSLNWLITSLILVIAFKIIYIFMLIKLKKRTINIVLIYFWSVLIPFYVVETYITLQDRALNQSEELLKEIRIKRANDEDVWPIIRPVNFLNSDGMEVANQKIFPLAGLSKRKTINCNENGYWSSYISDMYGFNNPKKVNLKEADILLIGDSFVHGDCVNQDQDFAGVMRKKGIKAVNLGYGGNGPLIELATLLEYGVNTKPKHILWFYFERNDLFDNLNSELRSKTLSKYLNKNNYSQNLIEKQILIDEGLSNYLSQNLAIKPNYYFSIIALKKIRIKLKELFITTQEKAVIEKELPNLKEFNKILTKAKLFAKQKEAKLTFVYIPTWERYVETNSSYPLTYRYNNNYNRDINIIRDIVTTNNISWINLDKYFNNNLHDPLDLYPNRQIGHFTTDGYEKIALFILKKLNIE
jgi:hypothetical protein